MDPLDAFRQDLTRRALIGRGARGIGRIALGSLMLPALASSRAAESASSRGELAGLPHFFPRARRVLCLFQSGGLSHVDLFDAKQTLRDFAGQELPASVKGSQRITGMTSGQSQFPVVPPIADGRRCGRSGLWISDLLPHLQGVVDELCFLKSLNTEAINHDPAITFMNTGNQLPGYASMGSWVSYGLGRVNENLPASHQGVALRPGASPVLYLANPDGIEREHRRSMLDDLATLNEMRARETGDPETRARIQACEMAFRMQASVPELVDTSDEPPAALERYGPEVHKPGSYAANCLLARRLLERGVRFVELFHRGWDQHIALTRQLPNQCRDVDQPTAAVIRDLRERGMLDDTLVVFATEFGRTVFSQGDLGDPGAGRDHHGRCFTVWLAGGGVRGGMEYGASDDFCYNVSADPVHLRDLHATILHCLGIDHEGFTYRFRGLDSKLTGVEQAHVVKDILL